MSGAWAWVLEHPELVAYVAISLLTLGAKALEVRWPRGADVLRAVACDLPGLVRAVRATPQTPKPGGQVPDDATG